MKRKIITTVFLLGMLLCSACSMAHSDSLTAKKSSNSSAVSNAAEQADQEDAQSTADLPKTAEDYHMIIEHDIQNYQITLLNLTSGEQICYEYTDGTEFFDKYGNYTLSQDFSEGKLAVIRQLNSNDTLGAIAFTDETWDYENVRNYTVSVEKRRMDIADTAYQLDESVRVFSEGEEKELTAIGESDILNVYGIGRTVYAIVIETGHGTLALTNTELFEGGWVNLGTKVYAKITRDMTMELPEGIYDFAVANDGYGDSGEIRIRRDKITTIDLNDYKGEGPKLCEVTFDVGIAGAILTINGKKVNHKKPMELRYGVYTLGVYAEGYDAWTKQLVINSPEAKIEILLSADSGTQAGNASDTDNNQETAGSNSDNTDNSTNITASNQTGSSTGSGSSKAGSRAGSYAGSYTGGSSSGQTGSDSNSTSSALANAALGSSLASIITGGDSTDYLDTLSDLVDSLDRLNRSSSDSSDSSDD